MMPLVSQSMGAPALHAQCAFIALKAPPNANTIWPKMHQIKHKYQ